MVTQTEFDSFRIDPKNMLSLSSNAPTLKVEKFNDSWHFSVANQARDLDVTNVLEPSYVPTTANVLLQKIVNFHQVTFVVSFQKIQKYLSTNVNM
jgi:hypothetical protein